MIDNYDRMIDYMRISITDRCNLRCTYCMPNGIEMQEHESILTFEEMTRICRLASELGIRTIKITGGEPFVRKDAIDLIRQIKELPKIEHVTITTNGVLLAEHVDELKKMGIDGINVSLDTLSPDIFKKVTGRNEFDKVWKGILKSVESGIPTKINCVPQKGVNDQELLDIVELAAKMPLDVRFIEMMPIGYGKEQEPIHGEDIYRMITEKYPDVVDTETKRGFGPARYISINNFKGNIGFIDAISHKFCSSCNRIRLTARGFLKPCLCYGEGVDLHSALRNGADDMAIMSLLEQAIKSKPYEHNFGEENASKKTLSEHSSEQREMYKIGG